MKRVKRRVPSRSNGRPKRIRGLSRPEMMSILCYCEHMFWSDFVWRAQMLDSTANDVCSDVKIFVWTAIRKYRRKPYTEVLKLGFRTAQNRLTTLSRSNLRKPFTSVDIKSFLPFLRSASIDPAKRVEFLDMMHRVAYKEVGMHKASLLLEATKLDWSLRNRKLMVEEHNLLCKKLDMHPHEVYKHVIAIRNVMRKNYSSRAEVSSSKEDGIWTQR